VKPLIPNAAEAGLAALRSRGLWPINHTIVIKDEVLNARPGLAADLYQAFVEAKRLYMDRLDDPLLLKVRDVIGDPLPYGVDANRQMLDAIVQHAQEQGIIRRAIPLDKLFTAV
jgi:4,5-dihydroxyphthalate decarboxylase